MTRPRPLLESELRGIENVPPSTTVDHELSNTIRELYAASLGSADGPPAVETNVALDTAEGGSGASEQDYVEAYRPEWLAVGIQPHLIKPERPQRVARARGGFVELLDTTAWIFGPDDRIVITPDTYPQSCVCDLRVDVAPSPGGPWRAKSRATGFTVGTSHVATASHVIPIAEMDAGMNWRMKVTPASVDGASVFGIGAVTFVSEAYFFRAGGLPPINSALDIAMLRTTSPIGNLVGYFGGLGQRATGTDWISIGYGYDRSPLRPKLQINVDILSWDPPGTWAFLPNGGLALGSEIETQADGAGGNSGGPLYKWFDTGGLFPVPLAGGVWSAHEIECASSVQTWHAFASGPLLGQFVTWARQTW